MRLLELPVVNAKNTTISFFSGNGLGRLLRSLRDFETSCLWLESPKRSGRASSARSTLSQLRLGKRKLSVRKWRAKNVGAASA